MSVLSCSRMGCYSVMCNNHSVKYGYLCDDCLQELIDGGVTDIAFFMQTEKTNHVFHGTKWAEIVLEEFGGTNE